MSNRSWAVLAVVVLGLVMAAPAAANHGPLSGHLPPSNANVDLVGKLKVSNIVPHWVTDVATYRDTAYVGAWSTRCPTPGGFWTIDISNPRRPRELTYVSAPPGSYQTEGLHAMRMTTPAFTGDLLVVSNETCGGEVGVGGISLYDVSNPAVPVPLKIGFGDTEDNPFGPPGVAHDSHSVFAWDTGNKAYAVFVDNFEQSFGDVDIADITDPRNPVMIAEKGLLDWPEAQTNLSYGENPNNHDMIVRRVEGHWKLMVSYWDAGYTVLNVDDPANPVFENDTDYEAVDPLTNVPRPEGNAHEAEWDRCPEEGVRSAFPCGDARYIVAADEDFSTSRLGFEITTGPNVGAFEAGEFSWTPSIDSIYPDGQINGPTVFGGSGCPLDDLNGNAIPDRSEIPNASTLPAAPGEEKIIVFSRGVCFFSEKVESGELAGYDVALVGNHHAGSAEGLFPNSFICGSLGHAYSPTIPGLCIGHRPMHLLFNDAPEYTPANPTPFLADLPAIGTQGAKIHAQTGVYDGWGYMQLYNADTYAYLDSYAIPEAIDPRYSDGFGTLSVHEVTTDPTGDVGYVSWYSGGLRVVDYSGGNLKEVGHHIDTNGNDHWGVELNVRRDGRLFVLASDRDYGLYIYRFGTDLTNKTTDGRGRVGRSMTLRSTVRNDGTISETNAAWSVRLPRGVRASAAIPSQGRCRVSGRNVSCSLGQIVEGGRAGILLRVVSTRPGTLRSQSRVNGRKTEYDIGNNTDPVVLRVRGAAGTAGAGAGGALTGRNG
jgi:hypothetical protein